MLNKPISPLRQRMIDDMTARRFKEKVAKRRAKDRWRTDRLRPCEGDQHEEKGGAPVWRRDEEAGQSYALKLTAAGAKAIAIDESAEPTHVNSREDVEQAGSSSQQPSAQNPSSVGETAPARPSAPRGGTKLAEVVELLHEIAARPLTS